MELNALGSSLFIMKIYQLLLYKNAQAIQDLDDYQVKKHGCHIEVQEEEELGINIDAEVEDLEEIDRLMRQPTKWRRPPK